MIIIINGQIYNFKYRIKKILEISMNILKFEKRNFFTLLKNNNLKNSSLNIKKFEKNFVFFSKK